MPVVATDAQVAGAVVLEQANDLAPRKRKMSDWQRFIKKKSNRIYMKNGKLNLKKMAVQYRKMKRGSK